MRCPEGAQGAVACRPCLAGTRRGRRGQSPADLALQEPGGGAGGSRLPTLPLACFFCPPSPHPFPSGEGGDQGYFMQGASPLHPRLNPGGIGFSCGKRVPGHHSCARDSKPCRFGCGTGEQWRQPGEGDRGRWNYPSQATAAFEMVLSPRLGEQVPPGIYPVGCRIVSRINAYISRFSANLAFPR